MIFSFFKKKPPTETKVEFEDTVVLAKVTAPDPGAAAGDLGSFDPARAPRPAPASATPNPLSEAEIIAQWLTHLPEQVRPYRLTDNYPRLAVKIAEVWMRPDKLQRYLRSLILDERGGRQGFPGDIASELFRLASYVEDRVMPSRSEGFGVNPDGDIKARREK